MAGASAATTPKLYHDRTVPETRAARETRSLSTVSGLITLRLLRDRVRGLQQLCQDAYLITERTASSTASPHLQFGGDAERYLIWRFGA